VKEIKRTFIFKRRITSGSSSYLRPLCFPNWEFPKTGACDLDNHAYERVLILVRLLQSGILSTDIFHVKHEYNPQKYRKAIGPFKRASQHGSGEFKAIKTELG
jgi:hypothetical protein